MHSLLKRQIMRYFGDDLLPDSVRPLLDAVSRTYVQSDQDRELLERSLDLSSMELNERYEKIGQQLRLNELAKRDLETTLSLLDATFNATVEGILVVDLNGRIVRSNLVLQKIWGIPDALLDSGDDDAILSHLAAQTVDPDEFVGRVLGSPVVDAPDGVDVVLLRDGRALERLSRPQMLQGVCVGRVWSFRDITKRKAAAASLELARRVFEVSSQGILVCDADFRVVDVNRSFCEMLGDPAQEMLGRGITQIGRWEPGWAVDDDFIVQLRGNGEWWGELRSGATEDGHVRVIWAGFNAVRDENGVVANYFGIFSDITPLKKAEAQLQQLAYFDSLTGLPNRRLFKERVESSISAREEGSHGIALLFVDLDRFKFVNDSLGHLSGDQLLVRVAERIRAEVRGEDIVSRQGGDEFAIALFDVRDTAVVGEVSARVINAISRPFTIDGQDIIYIGASIGICLLPAQAGDFEEGMRKADTAMYLAKAAGKGRYCFWDDKAQKKMETRMLVEAELRDAIRHDQLQVNYQPILDANDRSVVSLEALMRWQHPKRGTILPNVFIPVAEEIGLMPELESWLIQKVCWQLQAWRALAVPLVPVSINVSAQHMGDSLLEQRIAGALEHHEVPSELLSIEITESTAMSEPQKAIDVLRALRRRGVRSAIDDFGIGYSSLSHLKQLPVDTLKIDRSFVRDLEVDQNDRDIARAVVDLGHSMAMRIIAEGVETDAQLEILRRMGCDLVQGWLFAKAAPADEVAAFLLRSLAEGSIVDRRRHSG